jgi:hypothetical protein
VWLKLVRLSKHQKAILELLSVKPEMSTKELAEMLFLRSVKYKSKEYTSVHRSLLALERHNCIQRVQVQLRWRLASPQAQAEVKQTLKYCKKIKATGSETRISENI